MNPARASSPLLLVLFLSLAGCAVGGHGPVRFAGDRERDAVLAVVARAFEAIASQGSEAAAIWREVELDMGTKSSVRPHDGGRLLRTRSFADARAALETNPNTASHLERMWDPVVLIDGDIAMVWTRYDFWIDERLSHGGTDVIVLLRSDAGWKIASFAWTVEPDADPSPLEPPTFDAAPTGA